MRNLKYFEKLDNVDSLISLSNATGYEQTFVEISNYFDNPHIIKYFFEKIDAERWVDAILNSEFIKKYRSGKIEVIDNNQFDWFFMSYLLKVADKVPNQVSDYLKSIAAIDDVRLHERTIEVMLRLPCNIAADLVHNEIEWCKTKDNLYGLYPEFAGKLILHIQECNEEVAFNLIKGILKVDGITREVGKPGAENYYKTTDIKAKFSDWEYQSILNKYISNFVLRSENNIQNLNYLFVLLTNVLSLEKDDPQNDYSWVWRSSFDDNDQTRHISGIKEYLLITIRDLCIDLINQDSERFNEIYQSLRNYEWTILKRLSIYLSVKFPAINLDLTKELIINTELYESSRTRNEYSLLLGSAFGIVDQDARNAVYNWIENGIDLDNYVKRYKEHEGFDPDEEKIEDYKSYWKKNRLHLIRNHLKGEWLELYESLVKEKGVPDHPEYSSYTTSWVGPTSPMSVDEINELDVDKLIQELREWKPSGGSRDPSPEGLSRKFSEAIKTNINKYKHLASLFIGLSPTYIRGMFQGFRDNISSLDDQSWSEIFKLSEWVLDQDYEIEIEQDIDSDEDPGWSWCRKTIASLLDAGLKKGESQIPIDLK